jgi:hypothetical protein
MIDDDKYQFFICGMTLTRHACIAVVVLKRRRLDFEPIFKKRRQAFCDLTNSQTHFFSAPAQRFQAH